MKSVPQTISPLRRRMLEDMRMRRLGENTQSSYIRAVKRLAAYLKRSPDTATVEELRQFQLHLAETGTSPQTINVTLTGLRFFFCYTVGRPEIMGKTAPVRVPHHVPGVLSIEEARRLLECARNAKYQAALAVAYGAGLRAREVTHLRVSDVDSRRMTLRVEQGKGRRDRYAMLSPVMLKYLRSWWRYARQEGKMLENGWLFPGPQLVDPLSTRQLLRSVTEAAERAGIEKRVSMHTLRHSFATHLLERKVDIRVIQVLLGHRKLETTAQYTQVATQTLREVISPLDVIAATG